MNDNLNILDVSHNDKNIDDTNLQTRTVCTQLKSKICLFPFQSNILSGFNRPEKLNLPFWLPEATANQISFNADMHFKNNIYTLDITSHFKVFNYVSNCYVKKEEE